jgi:hypothetical protein
MATLSLCAMVIFGGLMLPRMVGFSPLQNSRRKWVLIAFSDLYRAY